MSFTLYSSCDLIGGSSLNRPAQGTSTARSRGSVAASTRLSNFLVYVGLRFGEHHRSDYITQVAVLIHHQCLHFIGAQPIIPRGARFSFLDCYS